MKNYFDGLKKIPFGIRLFAGLILCLSTTNLQSIQKISQYAPIYSVYFYLFVFPVLFVSGIFLLQLKEWARIVIIVLSLLAIVELAISAPYIINKVPEYYTKQYVEMKEGFDAVMKGSENNSEVGDEIGKRFMVSSQILTVEAGIAYSFLLYICIILYFTRPKNKAKFVN